MYLAGGVCRTAGAAESKLVRAGGVEEAVAVSDDSGGRRAGSFQLSRADLDRGFAERRSAMDYAIGRQARGGSDGKAAGMRDEGFTHGTDAEKGGAGAGAEMVADRRKLGRAIRQRRTDGSLAEMAQTPNNGGERAFKI